MIPTISRRLACAALGLGISSATWSVVAPAPEIPPVSGRPFQISESVKQFCTNEPKPMMCEQAMPLLAAMRVEPRDDRWAARIEALIAKFMRVDGKDWVQIRALECRSAHCALEYAVFADDLKHDADGDAELERLMEMVGGIVAPELEPGSSRGMMVSVLIWKKRL